LYGKKWRGFLASLIVGNELAARKLGKVCREIDTQLRFPVQDKEFWQQFL